jgi:hypothetical protein
MSNRIRKIEQQLALSPRDFQPMPAEINYESSIPAATPRLRISPHKTKFFGPSHWIHTVEQVRHIES